MISAGSQESADMTHNTLERTWARMYPDDKAKRGGTTYLQNGEILQNGFHVARCESMHINRRDGGDALHHPRICPSLMRGLVRVITPPRNHE